MTQAVEITTFRLNSGVTIQDFIAANADIDPWLLKQSGFESRYICERDDGFIVDTLIWQSLEAGHAAAGAVTTEMADSPAHSAIDQSTVTWTISEARHVLQHGIHRPKPLTLATILPQTTRRSPLAES